MKKHIKKRLMLTVLCLYAITWFFGGPTVHEYIDAKENHFGQLTSTSIPMLPFVLLTYSSNTEGIGGRSAVGLYLWYVVDGASLIEIPYIVA